MSTEIGSVGGVSITRFFGGVNRGVCLQLTDGNTHDYIVLGASQIITLLPIMKEVVYLETQRQSYEYGTVCLQKEELKSDE